MVPQVALSSEEVGPSDSEVRDSRLPPVATSHREGGSRFRSAEPTSLPPMRPPAMLRRAAAALALALGILAAAPASAFYLPGVAPNDFHKVPLPSPPPHLLVLLYVPSAPGLDGRIQRAALVSAACFLSGSRLPLLAVTSVEWRVG